MKILDEFLRRIRAWLPCTLFGILYGAATGGAAGALVGICGFRSGLDGAMMGTMIGACLGGAGGAATGALGELLGGQLGWGIAGCVGGLVASLLPLVMLVHGGSWTALLCLIPPVVAAALGVSVARGLRERWSRLPLVNVLVVTLDRIDALPGQPPRAASSGERHLVPAATPTARGDETTPAGWPRDEGPPVRAATRPPAPGSRW